MTNSVTLTQITVSLALFLFSLKLRSYLRYKSNEND